MIPNEYIALDLETDDKIPTRASIVEIAVARVRDGVVVERFASLVDPGHSIDETEASRVNGISDAMLAGAPEFVDVLPDLAPYLAGDAPVVAYNGDRFDRIVFDRALAAAGVTLDGVQWIDPYKTIRDKVPGLPSYTLAKVGSRLGVLLDGGLHRAAADVDLLIKVVETLRYMPAVPAAAPPVALAPAGPAVAPGALAELDAQASKIAAWIAAADGLPCDNDEHEQRVLNAIAALDKASKEIVKIRVGAVGAVKAQIAEIERVFRDRALKPIEAAIERLHDKRRPLALARARLEADRIAQAEREAARLADLELAARQAAAASDADRALAAALAGDVETAAVMAGTATAVASDANDAAQRTYETTLAEFARPAAPVVADLTTARDRPVWIVEVVDPAAVPAIYCSPDHDKIRKAIESTGGQIAIAGVRFELDVETRLRARR